MILLIRIKSQKSDFQTARQSQIDFKMANRSKYGSLNFVVEYQWVFYNKAEIAIFRHIGHFKVDLRLSSSLKIRFLTFDPD